MNLLLLLVRSFYGETLPAGPTASYEKDTIKYLTIEQVTGWEQNADALP